MPDTTVTVTGNLTKDPELRFLQDGKAVTNFSIAINTRKRTPGGEWVDGDTHFFDVAAFGQLAENVAESAPRGTRLVVTGSLKQESWEKDGAKRTRTSITAEDVGISLKWATAQATRNERQ